MVKTPIHLLTPMKLAEANPIAPFLKGKRAEVFTHEDRALEANHHLATLKTSLLESNE